MNFAGSYRQTITVAHVDTSQIGPRGQPVYLAKKVVAAKVAPQQRFVPSTGREQVISQYRIATAEPINPQDRIWLPGTDTTDDTASRQAVQIQGAPDRSGRVVQYVVDV